MSAPTTSEQLNRAVFYYERRRYDGALRACLEALASDPQNAHAATLAAWSSIGLERWADAAEFARQGLAQAPANDQAHAALAVVADHERRFDDAERHIADAIDHAPEHHLHRVTRGYIWVRAGRLEDGITSARQGLKLHPASGAAALALASFYRLNEEPELAERYAQQALGAEPESAAHHLEEGLRLLGKGAPEAARARFLESLRLDPADGDTFEAIAHETVRRHWLFRRAIFPPNKPDLALAAALTPGVWYLLSLAWRPFVWLAVASAAALATGYLLRGAFVLCRFLVLRRLREGRL